VCALGLAALLVVPAAAFDLGSAAKKAGEAAGGGGGGATPKAGAADAGKKKPTSLPPFTGPKKRLGVMDMEVKISATSTSEPTSTGGSTSTDTIHIPPPTDFGTGLTEMLTTALIDSGRFIVLERKNLADIQAEQALGAGGSVDPASAARAGRLLGAQALIRGAVTEFTYCSSSTGGAAKLLGGLGLAKSKAEATVVLDIRIYDANTGQIIDSVKADGHAKSSAVSIDLQIGEDWKLGGSSFSQTPLGQATREAIEKAVCAICKRMDTMPWEGRIAELDQEGDAPPTAVYINAGSLVGFKVGDQLEVFRAGRTITDPETRVVIGRTKDTCIGHLRIETVDKNLSTAGVVDGQGFKVGDLLKFLEPGQKPQTPVIPKPDAAPQPPPEPAPATAPPATTPPAGEGAMQGGAQPMGGGDQPQPAPQPMQ
jgi:curli biogenesis system outer membrane secretion channel CsgG